MKHKSVLLNETIDLLNPQDGNTIVDMTLGSGGHSEEICKRAKNIKIIGFDADKKALDRSAEKVKSVSKSFEFVNTYFDDLKKELDKRGIGRVDGIIFDLGLNSEQLAASGKGFSFQIDEPMKMTFLEEQTPDAIDVVNKLEEKELADIIFKYGEERASRKIAKAIVEARKKKPIITTFDLVKVINDVMPRFFGQRIHPATKTFQALRIYVNDELGRLERALDQALEKVKTGGRVVVISFHSLEDRIVKNFFRESEQKGFGKILTKKPIVPTDEEQRLNPRARSAKLRAFEKTI